MGTPEFAVPVLEALVGQYQVVAVVTQPDRAAGRGRRAKSSPVKKTALAHDLPVLQPPSLRRPEAATELRELAPDVIVVAAFGQILPPEVLAIPPHGCLNVHASLLPRYRGAAPITAAILAGEEQTGVTLMLMDEGMDTGPILAQTRCGIEPQDTTGSLSVKLAHLGADLLVETLPRWLDGQIVPQPQDDGLATYCQIITKKDGLLDWSLPATTLWLRVRAYHPWPGTYTCWRGKLLKILRARPVTIGPSSEEYGRVISLDDGVAVVTGADALLLEEVQLAGRKAMSVQEFIRGQRDFIGSVLGGSEFRI
ncbi:MAG TPA: methionyl-tRNA formyltransferase [Anaerolineae bacterium]|nr:methionyl-tRNA formyltransferase [Anaerolineae bacterium]